MRKEYDFSKGKRGAYNSRTKRQVTTNLDEGTILYCKDLSIHSPVDWLITRKRPILWRDFGMLSKFNSGSGCNFRTTEHGRKNL